MARRVSVGSFSFMEDLMTSNIDYIAATATVCVASVLAVIWWALLSGTL